MNLLSDRSILTAWQKNVAAWVAAIESQQIDSRTQVTDHAIVSGVLSACKASVLDIGCGEGWLARELSQRGLEVTGIDAVDGLVCAARAKSDGVYRVLEYLDISPVSVTEQYDLAVCNFSLLGKESVEHIFNVLPKLLTPGGLFIVQTLHPHACCADFPYVDGWREGSWDGFSEDFVDPPPWYFRTLQSWIDLYTRNDFVLRSIQEPIHPRTGQVASLLMSGRTAV